MAAAGAAAGAQVGKVERFLAVPADQAREGEPSLVVGHDFKRIIQAALAFKPKDPFETTEAFEARRLAWEAKPIYGAVTPSSTLAVNAGRASSMDDTTVFYRYDADAQQLQICLAAFPSNIEIDSKVTPLGTYEGKNAFGVAKIVRRSKVEAYRVEMPDANSKEICQDAAKLPPGTARTLLRDASFVVIGKLKPPYAATRFDYIRPTVKEPIERESVTHDASFAPAQIVLVAKGGQMLARVDYPRSAE